MSEEIVSIKGVAEYLGIHEITVYKLANEGKLPGFKVGGQWRFKKDALEQWIADEMHKSELELAKKEDKKRRKILIIDDNPDDVELITKALEEIKTECDIISATDGFSAWKEILKIHPNLLILDLKLPDIDGFKICENVRADADTKDIKILAITAFSSPVARAKILSMGANNYIVKDFKGNELIVQVKRLLGMKE